MKIAVKIPRGYEEKYNKLTEEQKEILKAKLLGKIAEILG